MMEYGVFHTVTRYCIVLRSWPRSFFEHPLRQVLLTGSQFWFFKLLNTPHPPPRGENSIQNLHNSTVVLIVNDLVALFLPFMPKRSGLPEFETDSIHLHFCFFFIQNPSEAQIRNLWISVSIKSPRCAKHTIRCASKSEYGSS